MNAQVELAADDTTLRQALHDILRSSLFARAPRTSNLLAFLVEKKLAGKESDITEHAIGLAVFRRDARCYDTSLDPVVRVQMGRLRARLKAYYAAQTRPGPHLSIPLGSYIPAFASAGNAATLRLLHRPLQLTPLRNLADARESVDFVSGVDEELGCKLFDAFGSLVQLPQQLGEWPAVNDLVQHRLEGSIRVENRHVRASMRLVDTRDGDVEWVAQFDCTGELGMLLQEELASAICVKLRHYLAAGA